MSETKEVQEVQILTEEQINALPKEVKESVSFLTEKMNPKDLIVLNPIVVELLNIEKNIKNIELIPMGEDGKFDTENVKSYKAIKASIGTFNSGVTSSAKTLKAPYTAISKSLVAIEKSIKGKSADLKASVMEKFKPYEDDVLAKAKAREEKKNKALIDAANEAKAENEKLIAKNKRSEVFNAVKYERIAENITAVVSKAIVESNLQTLNERKAIVTASTFETITVGLDMTVIDDVLTADLKKSFIDAKTNALKLIDNKLADFATQKQNIVLEAQSEKSPIVNTPTINEMEVKAEEVSSGVSDIPSPPGAKIIIAPYNFEDFKDLDDEQFYNYIKERLNILDRMIDDRMTPDKVVSPKLYKLRGFIKSIIPNV